MNIQKIVLEDMYALLNDRNLYKEQIKTTDEAIKKLESFSDSFVDIICEIDRKAFLRGATAMLDVVVGKEVL